MRRNRNPGYTLVELMIALVLFGIVATSIYRLLVTNQRLYREQTARVDVDQNTRAATAILPTGLRELDAADTAGSDIIAMDSSSITYKAMRSFYALCEGADASGFKLVLDKTLFYGLSELDASTDSLLIYYEGASNTRTDDAWIHADVTSVTSGTDCPGGGASLTVNLTGAGVSSALLDSVTSGAPVRGFEVEKMLLYEDDGQYWLGRQIYSKQGGGWSDTQPIVGPFTETGLSLTYYDSTGTVTSTPADVYRVGITVAGTSEAPVLGTSGGSPQYLIQDLVTSVALRNNRIY